jgi:hypothetical protein
MIESVKPLNKLELYIFTSPKLRRFIYRVQRALKGVATR